MTERTHYPGFPTTFPKKWWEYVDKELAKAYNRGRRDKMDEIKQVLEIPDEVDYDLIRR